MIRAKKILAPTDLSELSFAAVRYALEIGAAEGAEVIVYNVIHEDGEWFGKNDPLNPATGFLPRQRERLRAALRENCAGLLDKVKIRESVEAGVPYVLIVQKAEEEKVDLIVMSTHGRTGFEKIVLGSVTAKVAARAPCPVLSLRPDL